MWCATVFLKYRFLQLMKKQERLKMVLFSGFDVISVKL